MRKIRKQSTKYKYSKHKQRNHKTRKLSIACAAKFLNNKKPFVDWNFPCYGNFCYW